MEKINSTTFEKLTKSETLTLVKFGAPWCTQHLKLNIVKYSKNILKNQYFLKNWYIYK
jgi:hypothetical protein